MSITTIRAALETRLNGIASPLPTAGENLPYSPATGTAWQRVRLMVNDPIDRAVQNAGTSTAAAKAQAIADRFAPAQVLTSGATRVEIAQTARIGTAFPQDEWFCIPVSIPWQSFTG